MVSRVLTQLVAAASRRWHAGCCEVKGLQRHSPLLGLIVGQICLHASTAGMRMALPVYALDHGYAQAMVGPLIALFAVAPILLAMPAGRFADRHGYHLPARIAVLLTSGGGLCAALSLLSEPLLFPLSCLGALLSHPMVMTTLHQITPEARHGEAIALRSITINLSSALMPLAFGAVGAALGAAGLFWSMATLVSGGSLVARQLELSPAGPYTDAQRLS